MDTNFWECNNCKNLFTAKELYPCQLIGPDLKLRRYMFCADCLAEAEEMQTTVYIDELEMLR